MKRVRRKGGHLDHSDCLRRRLRSHRSQARRELQQARWQCNRRAPNHVATWAKAVGTDPRTGAQSTHDQYAGEPNISEYGNGD
jgi:hypothetical protein